MNLLTELIKSMSVVIVLAYILSRTRAYANIFSAEKADFKQTAGLVAAFGLFSVFGTLGGFEVMGAIANIRDLGPAVAGIIGGPAAGIGAGIIGGAHRYAMGGVTYIPCSVSTVLAGLFGGLIHMGRKGRLISITGAAIFMALTETLHMALTLIIVKPFDLALPIVQRVALPMIFTNTLGICIFIFIVQNMKRERETSLAKELIERELAVAREIQMSIVPKIFPAFPERSEFDVYAALEPAKEVGGDLYDFFLLDADHLCMTIGDVAGKGVPASLFMAVTKTLIKAKADIRMGPEEILYQVNNELCADNDSGMFVTVFLGILTISTGNLIFSNGGHNPPFIVKKSGGVYMPPKIPGLALGVAENFVFTRESVKIDAGDLLIMYTDGVTEAMNPARELLGEKRLKEALSRLGGRSAREACDRVLESTKEFADGAVQSDDITVMAMRYMN